MSPELTKALADFYSRYVRRGHSTKFASQNLKDLFAADPICAQEARERLAELDKLAAQCGGNLNQRCFVSHIQRLGLQEALNG